MNTINADTTNLSEAEFVDQINAGLVGVEGPLEALLRISQVFTPQLDVSFAGTSGEEYTLQFKNAGSAKENLSIVFKYTEEVDSDDGFTLERDLKVQYQDEYGNPFWIQ